MQTLLFSCPNRHLGCHFGLRKIKIADVPAHAFAALVVILVCGKLLHYSGIARVILDSYCCKAFHKLRKSGYQNFFLHTLADTEYVIPESVMIDFEQGMIPAWAQVFPLAPIKRCLFHLSKSIYRKVQSEGLAERRRRIPTEHRNA